jgi:hypothetical protein
VRLGNFVKKCENHCTLLTSLQLLGKVVRRYPTYQSAVSWLPGCCYIADQPVATWLTSLLQHTFFLLMACCYMAE